MKLQTLLDDVAVPDVELEGLSEHSGEVAAGFGFMALAASNEVFAGHCRQAVDAGAAVVLCRPEQLTAVPASVPAVAVPDLAARRGSLAAKFYGDPSARLGCIGVTGTNGKTSVAYHIADLSNRLGVRCDYCGTLGWGDLDLLQDSGMTTPNAVALQRILAVAWEHGAKRAALEISSHALAQHRADQIHFSVAVFTNLTRDHLDYHPSVEAYGEAKARLFLDFPLQAAVINVDDEYGLALSQRVACPVISYGARGAWQWRAETGKGGSEVRWRTPVGELSARLPVLADFAIANVTAAMAVLVALGQDARRVAEAANGLRPVPGRMELVVGRCDQPTVIVDYAHTPDALEKLLHAARGFCRGKLIGVIGCGGDRDSGKRPIMGAAAARHADAVWLTSDNPRSEEPAAIIAAMRSGIDRDRADVHELVDRAAAIEQAIASAGGDDVVVIAGKGHESYQEILGQRIPFDDRVMAREALGSVR